MTSEIHFDGTDMPSLPPGHFIAEYAKDTYLHKCPKCEKFCVLNVYPHPRTGGHRIVEKNPLTIQGSIICPRNCGAHYFVRNGQIEFV